MGSNTQQSQLRTLIWPKVLCVGVGDGGKSRLTQIANQIDHFDAILIDVAHGDSSNVLDMIKFIEEELPYHDIIAGNVATASGAERLWEAGADCVKVGVGGGSVCSTRVKTGCGMPQLSAILEVAERRDYLYPHKTLIADGGIRDSGDIVKCLAAGADAVMIGRLFAGCEESSAVKRQCNADEVVLQRMPARVAYYRGMASKEFQMEFFGEATAIEGESVTLPMLGSVREIFQSLIHGILSGMSYQGAHDLLELRTLATFKRQTPAGVTEGKPHALLIPK